MCRHSGRPPGGRFRGVAFVLTAGNTSCRLEPQPTGDAMPTRPLRDRIEILIAALKAADVRTLTLSLNDVTPEQLVDAYPDAKIETWVSRTGDRSVAIDSAKVPHYPDIEADRHRTPTDEEIAEVGTRPFDTPSQHYFEGDNDAA